MKNLIDTPSQSIPWGIEAFTRLTGGVPINNISVVETPFYHIGQVILGQYIFESLKSGETCALLTFDSAHVFAENFLGWSMDFRKYLDSEQLILLNYKEDFSQELGLSQNYTDLFKEVKRLSGGKMPSRIAIQQVDTFVNMSNLALINQCVQKLSVAANSPTTAETTILGCFVQHGDQVHRDLAVAFQKVVAGYFSVSADSPDNPFDLTFRTKKLPWFAHDHFPRRVKLLEGRGFDLKKSSPNAA